MNIKMNLNKIISLLLPFATTIACTQYLSEDNLLDTKDDDETSSVMTKSSESGTDKNYKVLENPYALDVMQAVYDSHGIDITLEPTDLYVRFMPADSSQLQSLTYEYGLELFDYPLDIELSEGDVYIDPSIEEGELSWQYTTVSPDFKFPEGIMYEILEECYIPEDGEEIVLTKGEAISVEEAAFLSLGYSVVPGTKLGSNPTGTIRVYDDYKSSYVPLKGVKIRCNTIVKWATAYTDESGKYSINKKFLIGPHYAIVFDNSKGFDIWGNWGPLAKANYSMGWHSKNGYSKDIDKNNQAWEWATVNNAAYDYYSMCSSTGITLPPENLKIWVFNSLENFSSAPMLRRVNDAIGFNGHSSWGNFFINIAAGYGVAATILNQIIKFVLPDITVGTKNKKSIDIYETVNHELSHASHCAQVGSAFWAKYVSYIMTYGAYGDGTGKNAELCGIGEMWGYSMGYRQQFEKYGKDRLSLSSRDGWIHPDVFWQLMRKNILTKKQIFDCLTADVTTYDVLVERMYSKYPEHADAIEKAFHDSNIYPNVEKPFTGDSYLTNQTISTSKTVTGENIVVQNVSITNNATLTLKSETSITINAPFVVEKDSQFNFTRQ